MRRVEKTGSGAVCFPQGQPYRKEGVSEFRGWQGPDSRSIRWSSSLFHCSIRALYSLACCGVRRLRISSSLSARCFSVCLLIASLCWSNWAMASAKSFAPGGLTYVTAGYSPTRILSVSGGRILESRIIWPFSSSGHPRSACQLYEWRKSTRASAVFLDRISDCHRESHSAESPDVGDGAIYGWISTPSSMPSPGEILIIFQPARSSDPYMLRAALLVSASGTNSMIAWRPANGFNGSMLVLVLPIDQNGITRGALQTARLVNDFSNSARLASSCDTSCSSVASSCVNVSVRVDTALALSWACPADLSATSADFLASPACCITSASNCSLVLRNSAFLLRRSELLARNCPLIDAIFIPIPSSPAIPIVISKTQPTSTNNLAIDGLSGDQGMPKYVLTQASISSRYSRHIIHNSIATPSRTKALEIHNGTRSQNTDDISRVLASLSRADMALSRAEMELSKAETSVGRLEAAWIKWAKITIALLFFVVVYGIWIIVVAVREEYVYKTSLSYGHSRKKILRKWTRRFGAY